MEMSSDPTLIPQLFLDTINESRQSVVFLPTPLPHQKRHVFADFVMMWSTTSAGRLKSVLGNMKEHNFIDPDSGMKEIDGLNTVPLPQS